MWGWAICLSFSYVKNCYVLYSEKGEDSGFTLEDEKGLVEIRSIRTNREDKSRIYLELARRPEGELYLSFAWQADPVKLPIVDEVTFLPPLAFYRVKLQLSL